MGGGPLGRARLGGRGSEPGGRGRWGSDASDSRAARAPQTEWSGLRGRAAGGTSRGPRGAGRVVDGPAGCKVGRGWTLSSRALEARRRSRCSRHVP